LSTGTGRGVSNQNVTTGSRRTESIRVEIIEAAYNFLAERLDPEQDSLLGNMKDLLSAQVVGDFVNAGITLSARLFPLQDGVFADEACEQWNTISARLYHTFLPDPILDVHCQFVSASCYQ
jgi:hypothetical protein